jgi:hypothetical protein
MSYLKTLQFSSTKSELSDPTLRARIKLVENLNEQLMLIKDPSHARIVGRWVKVDGTKQYRNFTIPVRPWWRNMLDGRVILKLKNGIKTIEFERGKNSIVITSKEHLVTTINQLILAIQKGELDQLLSPKNTLSLPTKPKTISKS